MGELQPRMRAGDKDRQGVVEQLGKHFGEGRLTVEEFDERVVHAHAAVYLDELPALTVDLPREPEPYRRQPRPPMRAPSGIFVLLIAKSLLSGKDFACFCFGDADSRLSRLTLVRTGALALLASVLAIAPLPYASFDQTYLLQAISAAAFVGTIALGSQIAKLLRWNRDPYGLGNTEVNR